MPFLEEQMALIRQYLNLLLCALLTTEIYNVTHKATDNVICLIFVSSVKYVPKYCTYLIIQILKWEFITHWLKLTCPNKTLFNLGLLNYIHKWIQSMKLQNHSHCLNQVLLHNSDPCSTLPFPLVCDLALVCTVLPDSVHSKLFLWFSSCQVYFHTQAPATKVFCSTVL